MAIALLPPTWLLFQTEESVDGGYQVRLSTSLHFKGREIGNINTTCSVEIKNGLGYIKWQQGAGVR